MTNFGTLIIASAASDFIRKAKAVVADAETSHPALDPMSPYPIPANTALQSLRRPARTDLYPFTEDGSLDITHVCCISLYGRTVVRSAIAAAVSSNSGTPRGPRTPAAEFASPLS